MKRKTTTTPVRIYTYGLRAPTVNAALVHQQLLAANRYYNKLIELERARRAEYREARRRVCPELAELEAKRDALTAAIDAVREEISTLRKKVRTRVTTPDLSARAKALGLERRELNVAIREKREELKASGALTPEEERITNEHYAKQKLARKESGLYWGTYLLIEAAAQAAGRGKSDPKFRRFTGEGRLGIQIQGGCPVHEIFGEKNTRIQIGELPPTQWDTRSGRRSANVPVRIRIGSSGDAPIWGEFPGLIHRPLPADGVVKWAWVKIRRCGPKTKYELQVVVEAASFERESVPENSERVAAINIGWRVLPTGNMRVGYLVDAFGKTRELVLPKEIRDELAKADSVRSINDTLFNTAKLVLANWIKENQAAVPDWLAEDAKTLHAWVNHGRLAKVARKLELERASRVRVLWDTWYCERRRPPDMPRAYRKQGTLIDLMAEFHEVKAWHELGRAQPIEVITFYLYLWRRKNDHLWDMEASKRQRAALRRLNTYRVWAAELSREYAKVVIEDVDYRDFYRDAKPEEGNDAVLVATRARVMRAVAPSDLRAALEARFGKSRVTPLHITRDHSCGHRNESEEFKQEMVDGVVVTCGGCGAQYDQDENAATNMLRLHLSPPDPDGSETEDKSDESQALSA